MKALALLLLLGAVQVEARLTSPFPTVSDIVCWGPNALELCVDGTANFVPTTNGTANLGSSSLKWNNLFLSGTLTGVGATFTGDMFVGGSTVTATGAWTAFVPVGITGCTSAISITTARYMLIGKTMFFVLDTNCTSNAAGWTINFPFKSGNNSNTSACEARDNSAFLTALGMMQTAGTGSASMTLYKTGDQTDSWTSSGNKRVICNGVFEIQ